MKKIAITGSSSALSHYLFPALVPKYELFSIGRAESDMLSFDLQSDFHTWALPAGLDCLIHTAAVYKEQTSEQILQLLNINILGTLKLCMAAKAAAVKHFIYVSSISATLEETDSHYTYYAVSKNSAEKVAAHFCLKNQIPLTIFRPSRIYDERGLFFNSQPLLYHIADMAEKNLDITIYGSHDAVRNYVHVTDVVDAIKKGIEHPIPGIFPVVYPKDISLYEIASAAVTAFQSKSRILFAPDKPDLTDNGFSQFASISSPFGLPKTDIQEGMKKRAEYLRSTV